MTNKELKNEIIDRVKKIGEVRGGNITIINSVKFSKIIRNSSNISIYQIIISLEDTTGIKLDVLKEDIDSILEELNITYCGLLIEI